MGVSINPMNIVQLGEWISNTAEFQTVGAAIETLGLTGTEGPGLAGTAFKIISGGAPAPTVSPTVSPSNLTEIINFAKAAELQAGGTEIGSSGIGLVQTQTGVKAVGLLGVDLGIVGAAVAPLLGVSLGAGLYELNPDLWTKLSQRLLPFCYPDTTKIPTWAEIAGAAWTGSISKAILDAIKGLFESEGIGDAYVGPVDTTDVDRTRMINPNAVDNLISLGNTATSVNPYSGVVTTLTAAGAILYWASGSALWAISNQPFTVTRDVNHYTWTGAPYTKDGVTYYGVVCNLNQTPPAGTPQSVLSPFAWWDLGYLTFSAIGSPSGEFPPGTSPWTGTLYNPVPAASPAVIGADPVTGDPVTQPMVPVSFPFEIPDPPADPEVRPEDWPEELPAPVPAPSQDPEEQPDPVEITDPALQLEPYIMPEPVPWLDPVPVPAPDPGRDPSDPSPPEKEIPSPPMVDLIPPIPTGVSPWPSLPTTPTPFYDVGLITVYHPTPTQFYDFSRWLWVTLQNADINTVWNNPFDGVITAFELYCTPTDNGHRTIHSGFLDSEIDSATISRYTEINCGTLSIPEYYGNYFDYSPYSKAHVYLPFIGIQELNVDDIVGHVVNITYRIDEYNGACIAMITVAKSTTVNDEDVNYVNTMYQFSGNCSVEFPLAGGSQAQIKAGLMMADATRQAALLSVGGDLLGGLGGLLTGNIGGLLGGIGSAISTYAFGQVSALGHMLSGKSTVQKSGTFGSSHGSLGIKTPFIVVTRPKQIAVQNYNDLYGYPAHKMVVVGSCTGFLRCREVHVISATATDEEKSKIESLLKSGVYVTE